jgi:hypothetical protein
MTATMTIAALWGQNTASQCNSLTGRWDRHLPMIELSVSIQMQL